MVWSGVECGMWTEAECSGVQWSGTEIAVFYQ